MSKYYIICIMHLSVRPATKLPVVSTKYELYFVENAGSFVVGLTDA